MTTQPLMHDFCTLFLSPQCKRDGAAAVRATSGRVQAAGVPDAGCLHRVPEDHGFKAGLTQATLWQCVIVQHRELQRSSSTQMPGWLWRWVKDQDGLVLSC